MRYVYARIARERREETYRIYLTDSLFALVNGGQKMTARYVDIVNPKPEEDGKKAEADSQEIKNKIANGLRRMMKS